MHVGHTLLLPLRSFSMNSGGYQLAPEHDYNEIFVQHGFWGSWKRKKPTAASDTLQNEGIEDIENKYGKIPEFCMGARHSGERICSSGTSPPGEDASMAFDGDILTKWLGWWLYPLPSGDRDAGAFIRVDSCKPRESKRSDFVQPQVPGWEKGCAADATDLPFIVSSYSITAANDFESRDPFDWVLEGRPSAQSNDTTLWTEIDQQIGVVFPYRGAQLKFRVNTSDSYASYRFRVTAIRNASESSGSTQLAEFDLEGLPSPPAPQPFCRILDKSVPICSCCGHIPEREGPENLFDDDETTKLLLQPMIPIDKAVLNVTIYGLPGDSGWSPVYEPAIDAWHELAGYILQSANDHPGRDPTSWRVWGLKPSDKVVPDVLTKYKTIEPAISANEQATAAEAAGGGWELLDMQTNVSFTARFEKLFFPFMTGTIRSEYEGFRLEIIGTAISSGVCSSASCTQLSRFAVVHTVPVTTSTPPWPVSHVVHWPGTELSSTVDLKLTVGGTITWEFDARSNLVAGTASNPTGLFGVDMLLVQQIGSTFNFTFTNSGTYPFFTTMSSSKTGVITVGGPSPVYSIVNVVAQEEDDSSRVIKEEIEEVEAAAGELKRQRRDVKRQRRDAKAEKQTEFI